VSAIAEDIAQGLLRLKNFVAQHPYGTALAVGTLSLAVFLYIQGEGLRTDIAPQRIVSLELAGDKALAEAIVASWQKHLHKTELQVLWDLPFILFYSLALFHFGLWASRRARNAGELVLAWAARLSACGGLLAGVLDYVEDWGLWQELHGAASDAIASRTAFCATTKFALIAAAIGVPLFVGFARQPADFTTPFSWNVMFRIARVTFGALALAALGLVVPPQTRDMLAGMSWSTLREAWSGAAFQLSLFLLAFFSWYWSRAALSAWFGVTDTPAARDAAALRHSGPGIDPAPLDWAPRLLFAAAAGIGVIAALRSDAWVHAIAILVWAPAILYVLYHRLAWGWYRRDRRIPWLNPLGGIGNLLRRAPFGPYCAAGVLAIATLAFVAGVIGALWPQSRVLDWTVHWIGWAFPGPSAALLFLGLILGPLTVLSYAADRLSWGGRRFGLELFIRPPVFLVLLGFVLVVPSLVDLHAVRVARSSAIGIDQRAGLDDLFAAWFEKCVEDKNNGTIVPVIVALSGGASRAGLWGARVLAEADAAAAAGGTAIFAVSSVSGGSLGATAYLATVAGQRGSPCGLSADSRAGFRDAVVAAAGEDALGPALAGALFGDLPRALFGVPLTVVRHAGAALHSFAYEDPRGGDRAEALERAFEHNWSAAVRAQFAADPKTAAATRPLSFSRPFLMLAYDPGQNNPSGRPGAPRGGPLWIANGTDAQNGERILTVPFNDGARLFLGARDALELLGQDVPMSTAIHNTARFAFLSPAGELSPTSGGKPQAYAAQLIDGGYFENEGLLTAWELARHLETNGADILNRKSNGKYLVKEVKPILVQATADAEKDIAEDRIVRCRPPATGEPAPPAGEQPSQSLGRSRPLQALVPLAGLYSVRGGHSDWILRRVAQGFCAPKDQRFFHFYLYSGDDYVPLNWVLSRDMSRKIWHAIEHKSADGRCPNLEESRALSRALPRATPSPPARRPEEECPTR